MPSASDSLEEIKKNIRALLISAPRGLSADDIEHDYRAMLGKPLPFKDYKCNSCLEFLKTLPDVVCPTWSNGSLILRGIADSSTRHIAKLVSRQKVTSKSRRISKPTRSTKPVVVPSYFRANIKDLLSCHHNGVLGSELSKTYAKRYGEEINYKKLGFKSLGNLLNSIPDIATIVQIPQGGFQVYAKIQKKSSPTGIKHQDVKQRPSSAVQNCTSINVPNHRQATDLTSLENDVLKKKAKNVEKVKNLLDSKSGVSEKLKEELISVLASRPKGVWAARLPFEYKALFNKGLSVLSMGFYSVIELVSSLPDIIRIERPFPNGDWLLFLAEKSKRDMNMTKIILPENAIGKGDCYCQLSLPDTDYIELYVTHVKSPDCFWVQLIQYSSHLVILEKEMRSFYDSKESAQFLMDDGLVKLGQVCVARFPDDGLWYRALITASPTQQTVEVFYVDYGNSCQVFKSDLRLMRKEFFQLPPQALKSKLANIRPKLKTKWDPSVAYRLHELTAEKALVGWVSEKKDDLLSLFICDTTSKDDIHINDVLVEEGYALFKQVSSERTAPPGLPSPNARQKEINKQMNLDMANQSFPDYSVPLNIYSGLPSCSMTPVANVQPPVSLPSMPAEEPPVAEEEKPCDEDIEFMRQVCEELSDGGSITVKRLSLPENKFLHLIKFQGKPFVVRSEISALLWESDLLRSMLRQKKMVVSKEVIAREDHVELFSELKRLKVGDFDDGDEVKEYASLYELSTIPEILETFKHPCTELIQSLKDEKATFEANPTAFWMENKDQNNDPSETDESCQSEPEEKFDLEELKLALQALQFRRKRIVRSMIKGELTPSKNAVDEVDEVEKQLAHIRDLIAKAEVSDEPKDTKDSKENKEGEKNPGSTDDKEKKDNDSSTTVRRNSLEEVKTEKYEELPVEVAKPTVHDTLPNFKNPENPSEMKQSTAILRENKVSKKSFPTAKQHKTFDKEGKYVDSVQVAKNAINNLSLGGSLSGKPRDFAAPKCKELAKDFTSTTNQSRFTSQSLKNVSTTPQSMPSLLGVPTYVPPNISSVPLASFTFPQTNIAPNNHLLPFSGFLGQPQPIPPPWPDFAAPPPGPYYTPSITDYSPVSSIYFPWSSAPVGPGALYRGNVRERSSRQTPR